MKKWIVFIAVLLSGCDLSGNYVHQAVERCSTHNGVDYLHNIQSIHPEVVCKDGAVYRIGVRYQ